MHLPVRARNLYEDATRLIGSPSYLRLFFSRRIITNKLLQAWDIRTINRKPKSFPSGILFSLANVCNFRCPMCSIRNLEKRFVRVSNLITLDEFKRFDSVLSRAVRISFGGFTGESILHPDFSEIIGYLKHKYGTILGTSTNCGGLDEKIQDGMLDVGFDSLTVSIHAFTPDAYRILQAGDLEQVKFNLHSLMAKKKERGSKVPRVSVAFALNRANIDEASQMLEYAGMLGCDTFYIYHYHDYSPGLKYLIFEPSEYGKVNQKIDSLYAYAETNGLVSLLPTSRPYYKLPTSQNEENRDEIKCNLPWTGLQLRSSFSHRDSYYLGCCNIFNAFLFNYKEHITKDNGVDFKKIWHHPVFQYLRSSVNSTDKRPRNPLCRYCKSQQRKHLKNLDNLRNYEEKLKAIDEFFSGFKKQYPVVEQIDGLQILFTEDSELRATV